MLRGYSFENGETLLVGDREGFLAQVKRFDYVVTNQPWDAKTWATGEDSFAQIFKAAFSYLPEP